MQPLRIVGGVLGSVGGASFMSVLQTKDTRLDFDNYKAHLATGWGLAGAVVGGFLGYYTPEVAQITLGFIENA
jgi:hypothetical protein